MGLLDKMKNLFTEEVDEEPVKSEVIQVEIPSPAKKEEINDIADSEAIKKEEKERSPIFFDDEYFKELEQPKQKQEIKSSYMKEKSNEKKRFTPTPIISPVYGVLDKNYNKDDITDKKDRKNIVHTNITTIDDVRRKAYGTLEDEIETNLFGSNSILFSETNEIDNEKDLFSEFIDDQKDDINIVEEEMDNTSIIEDTLDKNSNSDLFDLIDSMYEKEER